jgi:hypothetical protein
MKYQLSILTERLKPLVNELTDHITILSEQDGFTRVEITIESMADVLGIFHAGVRCGINYYYTEEAK